ncbi:L-type lectin-domain containing receptor kinase IX.1-like [Macadamia integrifolia]|uniref:L-type lectin-domain containing receptor kinase IX.1-like n=1 Tax=Macadamia integrifolia TaxID=60698 RepID=UPI001C4EB27C|nr:L-type lectin-domain containing receptor kinase IX.1-like [Macadamia integrifolia]
MALCNTIRNLPLFLFEASLYFSLLIPQLANPLNFSFPSFDMSETNKSILLFRDASISIRRSIDLTVNLVDEGHNFSIGRASYSEQLHLWDKKTGKLTDFTTHFSFVINPDKVNATEYHSGDGLAFFLSDPRNSAISDSTAGGGLGLFNSSPTTNLSTNSIIAVEFDTWKNPWDSNGNHIGININSIKAVKTVMLNNTSIKDGRKARVLVTYNSSLHLLSVFQTFNSNTEFSEISPCLSHTIDLRDYLPERVTVGFSAATGNATELHQIFSWDFCSSLDMGKRDLTKILVPFAISSIVVGLGLVLGLVLYLMRRKKKESKADDDDNDDDDGEVVLNVSMDDEFEKETGPRRFSYVELAHATNNFDVEGKLGEGGFGGVYKGFLRDLNLDVAVKRISKGSKQGIKEYVSEVKIISQLRHKNLVQLVGWCHQRKELLLVYEFMPNGTLDSHLFGNRSAGSMTWKLRHKIALDLAYALLYLHEEWEQCVIHRDVKSSNVILDSNFNAKLGDFGLARFVEHGKGSQTTVLAGTLGYMAPECVMSGKSSKESDVYSFGIVVLEIACGRRSIEMNSTDHDHPAEVRLVEWVWELYGRGNLLEAADPSQVVDLSKEQQIECLLIVGLWCAHPDYTVRPSIRQAMQVLNLEAPLPILPSKMPVPMYFSSPSHISTLAITSSYNGTATQTQSSVNTNPTFGEN